MAYFNHAFQQTFIPTSFLKSGGEDSTVLTPLEGAFLNAQSYDVANEATVTAGATNLILAMGSPLGSATGVAGAANDILGGNRFHGGYAETWKSKMINPNFVRFIGKQPTVTAVVSKTVLSAVGTCFTCAGEGPSVRLDLKGAPVLRAMNRNGYKILGGDGECCASTETYRDPATEFSKMAIQLLRDPILSQLVDIHVEKDNNTGSWSDVANSATASGNTRYEKQQAAITTLQTYIDSTPSGVPIVAGHLGRFTITDTSSETVFGNCSFDTRDYYQEEPLQVTAEQLDEDGNPCTGNCITVANTVGKHAETKGELILRDVMMYDRYRQHPTNQGNRDSARIREIEKVGPSDGEYGITRSADYTCYYVLHTVPRYNNPTGTFDNDQYLIKIATGSILADLETQLANLSTGAGLGGTVTNMASSFLPGYTGN